MGGKKWSIAPDSNSPSFENVFVQYLYLNTGKKGESGAHPWTTLLEERTLLASLARICKKADNGPLSRFCTKTSVTLLKIEVLSPGKK